MRVRGDQAPTFAPLHSLLLLTGITALVVLLFSAALFTVEVSIALGHVSAESVDLACGNLIRSLCR